MALSNAQLNQARSVALELLQKDSLSGHTYSLLHPIAQTISQRVKASYDDVCAALRVKMQGSVVVEGKRIMLDELYEAEAMVVSRITALLQRFN